MCTVVVFVPLQPGKLWDYSHNPYHDPHKGMRTRSATVLPRIKHVHEWSKKTTKSLKKYSPGWFTQTKGECVNLTLKRPCLTNPWNREENEGMKYGNLEGFLYPRLRIPLLSDGCDFCLNKNNFWRYFEWEHGTFSLLKLAVNSMFGGETKHAL